MKTDAEIRLQGMQALIGSLGLVEAERFLTALSRDRFDYTEWRRHGLPRMDLAALADAANRCREGLEKSGLPPTSCHMKSTPSPATSKPPRLRVGLKDVGQPEFAAAVRAHLGKQRVSIMLDGEMIAFFKAKAGARGYQTLIRDFLRDVKEVGS